MKWDVREIPLLGEMSQSDKRVAVFAEKPYPTSIDAVKWYLASDIEKCMTPEIPSFESYSIYITD